MVFKGLMMIRKYFKKKLPLVGLFALILVSLQCQAEMTKEQARKAIESMLPGQLLNDPFKVSWNTSGVSSMSKKMVSANGVPGKRGLRITNNEAQTNTWDAQVGSRLDFSVDHNEVIYVAFWARGVKSGEQYPKAVVRIAETASPWAHVINQTVEFSDNWNLYYLKGKSPRSFKEGELEFAFHLGLQQQSIELGQFYIMTLGQNGSDDSLPLYYPGQYMPKKSKAILTVEYPSSSDLNSHYEPGEGYELVWADEFDGDSLNEANWNRQVVEAGRFNEELQRYTDDTKNAYVKDGYLVMKAIHESETHGPNQYTSARLNTAGKQSWKYGKIVARMQLPHSEGVWPAFWMLGDNISENGGDTPWPECGEIDILELYGSKDDAVVEGNIHFSNLENKHGMLDPFHYKLPKGIFAQNFHIFEIEWDEKKIVWRVDGQAYGESEISSKEKQEFHNKFFILLNIAVGGTWAGRPDESSTFPMTMFVDWVRVYQQDQSSH